MVRAREEMERAELILCVLNASVKADGAVRALLSELAVREASSLLFGQI